VFPTVRNIKFKMKVSEFDDCPARLRLCLHGHDCMRKDLDCPFTHIKFTKNTWNSEDDENWPSSPSRTPSPSSLKETGVDAKMSLESLQLSSHLSPKHISASTPKKVLKKSTTTKKKYSLSSDSSSTPSSSSPPDSPASFSSRDSPELRTGYQRSTNNGKK